METTRTNLTRLTATHRVVSVCEIEVPYGDALHFHSLLVF